MQHLFLELCGGCCGCTCIPPEEQHLNSCCDLKIKNIFISALFFLAIVGVPLAFSAIFLGNPFTWPALVCVISGCALATLSSIQKISPAVRNWMKIDKIPQKFVGILKLSGSIAQILGWVGLVSAAICGNPMPLAAQVVSGALIGLVGLSFFIIKCPPAIDILEM